jgi:hypothetical protein
MTRKDSEKDSERPHYYSQFWLDVAAGRRVIGGPRPEEGEAADGEGESTESSSQRREEADEADASADSDDYFARPAVEPIRGPDEVVSPATSRMSSQEDEVTYQDDTVDDIDIPDMNIESFNESEEDEDEDEEYYEEGEEEEEDDDMNWGRGRKKGKPTRTANKLPPKKPGRRDPRRGF